MSVTDMDVEQIKALELERVRKRRTEAGVEMGDPARDAVGLALSGGGIRSATFNLGVLQAMHRYGVLSRVDYLSTVSGGGYIGSSLTWLMAHSNKFPFGARRSDHDKAGGDLLAWLRAHANYLTPGQGLDAWALAAAVLRGVLINLLILVPVFFSIIYYMVQLIVPGPTWLAAWPDNAFTWLFVGGLALAGIMVMGFICYALLSGFRSLQHEVLRDRVNVWLGRLLKYSVILLVVGALPVMQVVLEVILWPTLFGSQSFSGFSITGTASALTSALTLWAGWRGRADSNEAHGPRALLLSAGLGLMLYGLLLWLYNGAFMYFANQQPAWRYLIFPGLALSLVLGLLANINYVSMHRYYRDRLLTTFMPRNTPFTDNHDPDSCLLKDLPQTSAPYQIINTNLVVLDSRLPKPRIRGADNFIFSPLVCGSHITGYIPTAQYQGGAMDLATAFTISGAAVNPNAGMTRSRPLAAIMTLFNVRLGYWIRNPRQAAKTELAPSRPLWPICALREMLGLRLDETRKYVHLSDGGHFENLGLYELVRRRCRTIIVCDATADPDWSFGDLANATEKVRVDFGAAIEIDTRPLRPVGENRISESAAVLGKIHYVDGSEAKLLYINTSIIAGLSEDIYGYRRDHESFPDEPTSDQFFDEAQFEAYRELGFQIGRRTFETTSPV